MNELKYIESFSKEEIIEKMQNYLNEVETDIENPRSDADDEFVASIKKEVWLKAIQLAKQIDEPQKVKARLAKHWDEDLGDCLWWDFPVEEPPYCGTPLDDDFPKYKTHFTELHIPDEVEEEPKWVVKIEDNGSAYFVDFFDELQPHLVYGLSGEVMRFDSEDKANAIVTLIECGTVEKV